MIDDEIIALAKERISIEIAEQEKQLTSDIETRKAEMASRGMLASSMTILEVQAECAKAVTNRATLVWNVLHRTITTMGVQYHENMSRLLIDVVQSYLPEHMNGLKYRVMEFAQSIQMQHQLARMGDEVENSRQAAIAKVSSEIKLFVMALKRTPGAEAYTQQINFYHSNVGAVQTGNQSVANIVQRISTDAKDALLKALELLAREINRVDDLPGRNKIEIVELVAESKNELLKSKPNLTKVSAYLPAIGGAIEAVANLKPAYEMLKGAADLIGVKLP